MSAAAQIHSNGDGNWSILENGEVRATYPSHAIRFSILWKAAIGNRESKAGDLTLDRIMAIFTADLCRRRVDFQDAHHGSLAAAVLNQRALHNNLALLELQVVAWCYFLRP